MRQPWRVLVVAAVVMVAAASARAGASASVEFTGSGAFDINMGTTRDYLPAVGMDTHGFTLETSGAVFTMANLVVSVPRGGAADFLYDYTIALHDEGQLSDRAWGFCVPLSTQNCGPAPTGNEIAAVSLVAGFSDGRNANPYLRISGESVFLSTDGGSFADGVEQSGRLHVHVQASSDPFAPDISTAAFSVYALATVDESPVSPVPEPASYALMLAGLGCLALKAHRQQR